MIEFELIENQGVYNSPMEFGLRALFLMAFSRKEVFDLQKLIYLDYLAVHSDDVDGGPIGLHAKLPYRATEVLVKRELVEKGIRLLVERELIIVVFDDSGISYKASSLGIQFIDLFESDYARNLRSVSEWISNQYSAYSVKDLEEYVNNNFRNWGGDNDRESIYRKGTINNDEFLYI